MDINWSKTFFMIVAAKQKRKISVPTFIKVGSNKVADNFKLLCVLIDNKLTFTGTSLSDYIKQKLILFKLFIFSIKLNELLIK